MASAGETSGGSSGESKTSHHESPTGIKDSMDGKASSDLSTTDVFEIAAELSAECAKIGNRFGQDTVVRIVPCVVRVLEELEFAVERAELLTADLVEAQHEAEQAKEERDRQVAYRRKVETEYQNGLADWERKCDQLKLRMEEMQGQGRAESKMVMKASLASHGRSQSGGEMVERVELVKAQELVESLRQEVHSKNIEEAKQSSEVEALMQQVKRLAGVNQALRRASLTSKQRTQTLVDEKTRLDRRYKDLEAKVKEHDTAGDDGVDGSQGNGMQSDELKEGDSAAEQQSPDRSLQLRYTRADMEKVLQERLNYKLRVDEVEEELSDLKESMGIEVDVGSLMVASRTATLPRSKKNSLLRNMFQQLDEREADQDGEGADVITL